MRRTLFGLCALAATVWVLAVPGHTRADIAADSTDRPNVVFIMTDDQTVADMQFMPKTSQLIGDAGTAYSTSWTSLSWCCPSRATMKTGQHAHNHGVSGNALPAGGFERFDDSTALPVWMQSAGYRTIHIGKAMNDTNTNLPAGWDRWQATLAGDHKMYNWRTIDENGTITTYGTADEDYQGDVYAQMVVDEIEAADGPFFIHFTPSAPHRGVGGVATPPRRHLNTVDEPLPRPPSFNDPERLSRTDIADLTKQYRRRAESLRGADDAVEWIVDALDRTGQLENTVIIFTSDNGFLLGEHGQYGKSVYWHEAMTVPLLIRGPGFESGLVEDAPVQNIDLAPTIADIAGATPLIEVDGRSLLDPVPANRGLYFESKRDVPSEPLWEGVRSDRFVLVDLVDGKDLLWDMHLDPWQMHDRIDDPAYEGVEATLRGTLRAVRDCAGSSCHFEFDNSALDALVGGPPPTTLPPSTTSPSDAPTTTSPTGGNSTTITVDEVAPWQPGFTVTVLDEAVDVVVDPLSQRTSRRYQVRWKIEGSQWTWESGRSEPHFTFDASAGELTIEVRAWAGGGAGSFEWRPWHATTVTVPPPTTTPTTTPTTSEPPPSSTSTTVAPTSSFVVAEVAPWQPGFTVTVLDEAVDVVVDPLSQRTSRRYQVRWKIEGSQWTWESGRSEPHFTFDAPAGDLVVEVRAWAGSGSESYAWRAWNGVTISDVER